MIQPSAQLPSQSTPLVGPVTRQVRTLKILECLQVGPALNARELSEVLNVSERTIYRDIRLLRSAGVDVSFDEQRKAYRLGCDQPAFFNAVKINNYDLARIVIAAHFSSLQAFPEFSESSRELLNRALAHHEPTVRTSLSRMLDACSFDIQETGSIDLIEFILLAIRQQRRLHIQFREQCNGRNRPTEWTRFAPYHLKASASREWEVEGESSLHNDVTRFGLNAIVRWELTDEPYCIPDHYHWHCRQNLNAAASREKPVRRRPGRSRAG